MNSIVKAIIVCSVSAVISLPVNAHEYYAGAFKIVHPWSLESAPKANSAKVGMSFENIMKDDELLSATTMLAEEVQFHKGDGAASQRVKSIPIKKGQDFVLKPESTYLKLINLKLPLLVGRSYPMNLEFKNAGSIYVTVTVGPD